MQARPATHSPFWLLSILIWASCPWLTVLLSKSRPSTVSSKICKHGDHTSTVRASYFLHLVAPWGQTCPKTHSSWQPSHGRLLLAPYPGLHGQKVKKGPADTWGCLLVVSPPSDVKLLAVQSLTSSSPCILSASDLANSSATITPAIMNHIWFLESIMCFLFLYLCPCFSFWPEDSSISPTAPLPTQLLTLLPCMHTLRWRVTCSEFPERRSWGQPLEETWKAGGRRCSPSLQWQQRPQPAPWGALKLGWPIRLFRIEQRVWGLYLHIYQPCRRREGRPLDEVDLFPEGLPPAMSQQQGDEAVNQAGHHSCSLDQGSTHDNPQARSSPLLFV